MPFGDLALPHAPEGGAHGLRMNTNAYRHIEVRPIAGAIGAEVRGVDARALVAQSEAARAEAIAEIRRAFLEHLVIFLPGQKLAPRELLAFAACFGEPMEYPQLRGLPECPLVTPVVKLEYERHNFGGV